MLNWKHIMYQNINQFWDEFTAKIINVNPLSTNPTKWSNTMKQFNSFLLFLLAVILLDYHTKNAKQYLPWKINELPTKYYRTANKILYAVSFNVLSQFYFFSFSFDLLSEKIRKNSWHVQFFILLPRFLCFHLLQWINS